MTCPVITVSLKTRPCSRVPQLVVTRMGRYRPWLLAFWDFVQLVRVCPRLRLCREGSRLAARGASGGL